MRFGIRTLDELSLVGKTVLCRVDINQPVDRTAGKLKSINRIKACVPTISELSDRGARVVLLAHQGSDIEYTNYCSTEPHRRVLEQLLGRSVQWIDDVCGPAARERIQALRDGEILLLDNVRFMAEEQTLFELKLRLTHEEQAKTRLVEKLAPLADCYVCDAFAAAHRNQPSLCGFEQLLPSAMGRLFEQEYCAVSQVMEASERPCVFVLGGAKIADAFQMMKTVLAQDIADRILTGGLVANIFLLGQGKQIGAGSYAFIEKSNYTEFIEKSRELYAAYGHRILLPHDLAWVENGIRQEAQIDAVAAEAAAVDIGSKTITGYIAEILAAKTVFVNGPMGVFEQEESALGTEGIWRALAQTEAYTVLGGGDSIAATEKYGLAEQMSYICTGGGALIRFLSGEELPVVKALRHGSLLTAGGKG